MGKNIETKDPSVDAAKRKMVERDKMNERCKDPRVNFAISLFNREKELKNIIAKEKNRVRNVYEGFIIWTKIDYCFMRIIIYYVHK